MDTSASRFFLLLLTLVTIGMIVAFFQLPIIGRLEDSRGTVSSSLTRISNLNATRQITEKGISFREDGEDIINLRLRYVKPKIISWSPRIISYRSFLSVEECEYLIEIAKPHLQASLVVDESTGKPVKSTVRTSHGMSLISMEHRKHPTIQAIEERISIYSHVPVENGEFMQIIRYAKNQFYKPHYDYFDDALRSEYGIGGQRVATMLMYLNDDVEGGETYFPEAGNGNCSCGGRMVTGLCFKPHRGDALLFWNVGLDGKEDPNSEHGGCEVLAGEKWSATKWLRQNNF